MNVPPSSTNEKETARRAFLTQIEALLPTTGIAWTVRETRLFGLGIVLTAPGISGEAQLITISHHHRQIPDDGHIPEGGTFSYQLLIKNASDYTIAYYGSQEPEAIIAALKVWGGLSLDLPRRVPPSLGEEYLASLRSLATIRATVSETTRQTRSEGIERGSEAFSKALGVIRDSAFSSLAQDLTPAAQQTLADDLHHLAPNLLLTQFPREADGRFPLRATVLLASYDSLLPQGRDRQMWLVASAPQRRRDPQVITLTLASLIGVNHAHRWDQTRWFWDSRQETASEEERWGVTDLDLSRLGLEKRSGNLAFFTERCSQPAPSLADRVSLCLLLQEEGRFEEAFALFDICLTSDVLKTLYQQPLSFHSSGRAESWASTLSRMLFAAAPWRFASLPMGVHHRLCVLPHQAQQRKACLILVTPKQRQKSQPPASPFLAIEYTASNKFLPHSAWQRPHDLDLLRFQLL